MDRVLVQQNSHWEKKYTKLFNRNLLQKIIKKLSLKEIQILVGIRRCGKSTILKLIINKIMQNINPKSILYINLDDPFFIDSYKNAKNIYSIVETAEKITGVKVKYLFLDEIQNIDGWEKYVKSVYDSEIFKKIFITGSNSELLKGEYANLLSGRYVVDEVFPLSFNEILKINKIQGLQKLIKNRPQLLGIIDKMMIQGSYPEIYKIANKELKQEVLNMYFETILYKDCIANAKIRDVKTFIALSKYLISNTTSSFSYNNLAKILGSNEHTIKGFIHAIENSYFMLEIYHFSFSLKKQERSNRKIYCIDNGFSGLVSFKFTENRGVLFENLVFTELLKLKYKIYNYTNSFECDFIIKKNENYEAIQVCYELNEKNKKREVDGIKKALILKGIIKGYIITYNQEGTMDGIKFVPFWKFFS